MRVKSWMAVVVVVNVLENDVDTGGDVDNADGGGSCCDDDDDDNGSADNCDTDVWQVGEV